MNPKTDISQATQFRDRIRELRRVPAKELRRNPKNHRVHGQKQSDAMRAVLDRVGYADAVIAREDSDGSLVLLNGHLRSDIAGDAVIPVLVLDVNESEGDQILATFDAVGSMAEIDRQKFDELAQSCDFHEGAIAAMINEVGMMAIDSVDDEGNVIPKSRVIPAEYPISPVFNEKYDYVIIVTKNTVDFSWLVTNLKLPRERSYKSKHVGVGRAMMFSDFLKLWNQWTGNNQTTDSPESRSSSPAPDAPDESKS